MRRNPLSIVCALLICCCVTSFSPPARAQDLPPSDQAAFKQNGGAPGDFAAMALPDPRQAGQRSTHALYRVEQSGSWWSRQIAVDSASSVAISLIGPGTSKWEVNVALPDGSKQTLAELSQQSGGLHQPGELGLGEQGYPAETYTVLNPQPGLWEIGVKTDSADDQGFLLIAPESTYGLYSYLSTNTLLEGQPIRIAAYLYAKALPPVLPPDKEDREPEPLREGQELSQKELDQELELRAQAAALAAQQEKEEQAAKESGALPEPPEGPPTEPPAEPSALPAQQPAPESLGEVAFEGQLVLHMPDGGQTILPLQRYDDPQVGDATIGADLPDLSAGLYTAQLQIRAWLPDGTLVERTSEQLFPVLRPSLDLTDQVTSWVLDDTRLALTFMAEVKDKPADEVYVYAQVWGRNAAGEMRPAAWIGGLAQPFQPSQWQAELLLTLDARWLALAGVTAPLELREVRVQDADTWVPLSVRDVVRVEGDKLPPAAFEDPEKIDPNDPELHQGRAPAIEEQSPDAMARPSGARPSSNTQQVAFRSGPGRADVRTARSQQSAADGLFLVHGYCSGPVWPVSHFDDGPTGVFKDTNANRSHNAFARLIRAQGAQSFSRSFSVVAHSQGGAAALELYTRYWSGLDYTKAPRRIQSLGTPYGGSQLAGGIALIGMLFGGCGPNWNLTTLGSLLWRNTIPNWARQQVHFARTHHGSEWIFSSICHASSLLIPTPDDGVVSLWAGYLPGGHDLGVTAHQCHSTGMLYPPQYSNPGRNAVFDFAGRYSTDIGVIPDRMECPNGQRPLEIYMDDEDNNNKNWRGGWFGATRSDRNTRFVFCRVPGHLFGPLSTSNDVRHHYAVLKLGSVCPSGSVPFVRSFDNEDNNNTNWYSGSILPNISDRNTQLHFCLFRSGWPNMGGFPHIGIGYGVFAAGDFSHQSYSQTGYVYTDDEDRNNQNQLSAGSGWWGEANRIIVSDRNTFVRIARVR